MGDYKGQTGPPSYLKVPVHPSTTPMYKETTYELGLVVMIVGFFYRVSLHLSFVENIFASGGASESERE